MDHEALPIYELDEEIVSTLSEGNRLVLEAPTGSGKSTQVPQILLDGGILGNGRCVILQPRRLAARMLAARRQRAVCETRSRGRLPNPPR